MKKLVGFIGIVVCAGGLRADTLVFNPGFDMTPWDTGWTYLGTGYGMVYGDSSKYCSAPRSCRVEGYTGGIDHGWWILYQEMHPVVNCTCKVDYQYTLYAVCSTDTCSASASIGIYVKVNGQWEWEWGKGVHADSSNPNKRDSVSVWTEWKKIYNIGEVISGIEFDAYSIMSGSWGGAFAGAEFWIDDVYISGQTAVEESEKFKVKGVKLDAYPNPFRHTTVIRVRDSCSSPHDIPLQITIHDLAGRIVRTFQIPNPQSPIPKITWDGTDEAGKSLTEGIYFAKLITGEEEQVLKLILLM